MPNGTKENLIVKIHLLMHLDGGNRGCEAITKSTAILLKKPVSDIYAYSKNTVLDTFLGITKYCMIKKIGMNSLQKIIRKILCKIIKNTETRKKLYFKFHYLPHMKKVTHNDIYLSTGGDMMCYVDNEAIYTNNYLHNRGVKTVLWGCSMGPENATPAKLETLKNFSAIYARESLSYKFFKDLGLKSVFLLPDPAFILMPQPFDLPSFFKDSEVVGVNLSNYVLKNDSLESDKAKQVLELLNYILDNTKYHVLLIPHVFWNNQDDRVVSKKIKSKFAANSRVSILNSEQLNYCEIRYVISKCRFFVGARTHSVISAYSMQVPSIALGYSIKSRGIAKDIGLPKELVVDFRDDLDKSVLLNAFLYMQNNETQIRSLLQANIPPYIKKLKIFDFNKMMGALE